MKGAIHCDPVLPQHVKLPIPCLPVKLEYWTTGLRMLAQLSCKDSLRSKLYLISAWVREIVWLSPVHKDFSSLDLSQLTAVPLPAKDSHPARHQ